MVIGVLGHAKQENDNFSNFHLFPSFFQGHILPMFEISRLIRKLSVFRLRTSLYQILFRQYGDLIVLISALETIFDPISEKFKHFDREEIQ